MQTLEHNRADDLYTDDSVHTDENKNEEQFFYPHVLTLERDDFYTILLELPDVKKRNIHVSVGDNSIIVEAERHHGISYIYERRFPIKSNVVKGGITTRIDDGLVSIRLPKTDVELKPSQKRMQHFPAVQSA